MTPDPASRLVTISGTRYYVGPGHQVLAQRGVREGELGPDGQWHAPGSGYVATYAVDPAAPYGPHWGTTVPPALWPIHRPCEGARGGAAQAITDAAERVLPGDYNFRSTMLALAMNESGQRRGRPANTYDMRERDARPEGKSRIGAWGCYQFNAGAWSRLWEPDEPRVVKPEFRRQILNSLRHYDDRPEWASEHDEVYGPVAWYGQIWRNTSSEGGTQQACTASIWLYHSGPAYYSAVRDYGFGHHHSTWHLATYSDQAAFQQRLDKALERTREQYR